MNTTDETKKAAIIPEDKNEDNELEPKGDDDANKGNDDDKGDDDKGDDKGDDDKSKKPIETPEAKRARLKRQLEQHEKKMGLKKEESSEKKADKKEGPQLSQTDLYTLMKADVHEDDIQEVADYAKLKGITIKEALNSSTVKGVLSENKENRDTAAAANTGTVKRGTQKVTGDTLVEEAKKGKMPESETDIRTLIKTRKGIKS